MSALFRIFYKSFVKPFYRENAGTFVFVFTMFFFVVGTVDGAGLFKYHYGLIKALLSIKPFLGAALLLWALYARKCAVFIAHLLRQPHYQFISIFRSLPLRRQYLLFFITDFILLLPQTFYILLVLTEGLYLHLFPATVLVLVFLLACCVLLPVRHVHVLNNPEKKQRFFSQRLTGALPRFAVYPQILIRAVLRTQKLVWLSIKLFTGALLCLMSMNNTLAHDDLQLMFLLFSFGVLANGVFVNHLRRFEEQYLSFYRSLPVPLIRRLAQYACFNILLLLPEAGLLCFLSPAHISVENALALGFYAFSAIQLLISISFVKQMAIKHLVVVLLLLFFGGYFILMASGVGFIGLLFLLLAIILFLTRYYRSETTIS